MEQELRSELAAACTEVPDSTAVQDGARAKQGNKPSAQHSSKVSTVAAGPSGLQLRAQQRAQKATHHTESQSDRKSTRSKKGVAEHKRSSRDESKRAQSKQQAANDNRVHGKQQTGSRSIGNSAIENSNKQTTSKTQHIKPHQEEPTQIVKPVANPAPVSNPLYASIAVSLVAVQAHPVAAPMVVEQQGNKISLAWPSEPADARKGVLQIQFFKILISLIGVQPSNQLYNDRRDCLHNWQSSPMLLMSLSQHRCYLPNRA